MSQSLRRALQIVTDIGDSPLTIAEAAERIGVHATTALRLLQPLEQHGFVRRTTDGKYELGSRLIDLGQRALESMDVRTAARPWLKRLAAYTGETVHLAVIAESEAVYIDKVESQHHIRMYSRVGIAAPMHCTGVGKALLLASSAPMRRRLLGEEPFERHTATTRTTYAEIEAALSQGQRVGYVLDDEEHEPGVHCIAAPIRHRDGSAAGSLSITAPTWRIDRATLLSFAPELLRAVASTSRELGTFG